MRYAIVGGGLAGLSCADGLKQAGHSVAVFDKGHSPGGRMSTRRWRTSLGEVAIDHGAQYFTARDPAFKQLVTKWREMAIVDRWPLADADAWIGVPGMNVIIRQMASVHAVTWGLNVTALARKSDEWWLRGNSGKIGPFDAIILAIPAEQAAAVLSLHDFSMARVALMARSQPCWTSMYVFERPLDNLPAIIRDRGTISWAARNSAKPGRRGPEAWVVQASGSWSVAQLETPPENVSQMLYQALSDAMGCALPQSTAAISHRWRYAVSAGTGDGSMWNESIGLGVCGDWLLGPRVECAWLSGRMLAERCNHSNQNPELTEAEPAGGLEHRQFV